MLCISGLLNNYILAKIHNLKLFAILFTYITDVFYYNEEYIIKI